MERDFALSGIHDFVQKVARYSIDPYRVEKRFIN